VDITPEALKVGLNTQIYLGNLKAQPDYKSFVAHNFIEKALSSQ
jgi:NitT/TauT family transport system substrate-binding protein